MADEIIREAWRIKDEIAREHGNDVRLLVAELRDRLPRRAEQVVDLRARNSAVSVAPPDPTP